MILSLILEICCWFGITWYFCWISTYDSYFCCRRYFSRITSFGLFSLFLILDLITFGYSTLVWFYLLQRRNLFCWILLHFTQILLLCQILLSIVLVSFVGFTIKYCIYWKRFQFLFHFCISLQVIKMFHQLESRKRRVQQNCLVITSNTPIIPAMIFRQLLGLSRYIQSYYMESSTQMFLDIETSFNLQMKDYLPGWNDSFVEYILHLFTSQSFLTRLLIMLSTLNAIMQDISRMRNFSHI